MSKKWIVFVVLAAAAFYGLLFYSLRGIEKNPWFNEPISTMPRGQALMIAFMLLYIFQPKERNK